MNEWINILLLDFRRIDVFLIELPEYDRNCPKGYRDYKAW
jgi:hypothetical protein